MSDVNVSVLYMQWVCEAHMIKVISFAGDLIMYITCNSEKKTLDFKFKYCT